ncbi:hypothetical protein ADUPG1_008512, partial [Aduncisulcus paluster]
MADIDLSYLKRRIKKIEKELPDLDTGLITTLDLCEERMDLLQTKDNWDFSIHENIQDQGICLLLSKAIPVEKLYVKEVDYEKLESKEKSIMFLKELQEFNDDEKIMADSELYSSVLRLYEKFRKSKLLDVFEAELADLKFRVEKLIQDSI